MVPVSTKWFPCHLFSSRYPSVYFLSVDLSVLDIPYKWNHQYKVWSFVTGFLHLPWFIQTVACISVFFLLLNNIPLYGCTTFCLSVHHLMGFWFLSTFWFTWIMLQGTFIYKFCVDRCFHFSNVYTYEYNCWLIG